MARPSMRSCRTRWARTAKVLPVGADGLIDDGGARRDAGRGPGAGRDPAGQQRDRRDPAARRHRRAGSRGGVAAARRLRAERRQGAAARRRFHRRVARTSSAGRRASARCWSGTWPRWSRSAGRRRAIAAAPRTCRARWPSPRRSRRRPYEHGRGWRRCARRLERASRPRAAWSSARTAPRIADDRRHRDAGRVERRLLVQFDLAGIAVSAGSACSSGKMKASAVLAAMGVAAEIAGGVHPGQLRAATRARPTSTRFLAEWRRIAERAAQRAA